MIAEKSTRFITCLPIDELFNRIKNKVGQGSNTRCSLERTYALAIDSDVLCGINNYLEIERTTSVPTRNSSFPDNTFKPSLKRKSMDEDTKKLELHKIAGTGDAPWYSPQAQSFMRPYCELGASKICKANGSLATMEHVWLSSLFHTGMIVRTVAEPDLSYLCLGHVCSVFAILWPVVKDGPTWKPKLDTSSKAKHVVVCDLAIWRATPVQIIGPMHNALLKIMNTDPGTDGCCTLPASHNFGVLKICLIAVGEERPLLQTAALEAFWDLPLSFLVTLAHYLELSSVGCRLFDVLQQLLKHLVPSDVLTDEIIMNVMTKRRLSMEPDDDLQQICDLEYVLDTFDKTDRKNLEVEINVAANSKADYAEFSDSVAKYKAHSYFKIFNKSKYFCTKIKLCFISMFSKQVAPSCLKLASRWFKMQCLYNTDFGMWFLHFKTPIYCKDAPWPLATKL